MITETIHLSVSAVALLTQASQRDDRLAPLPTNLPPAARNAVCKRLLKDGLLEEVPAPLNAPAFVWRRGEHDALIAARITDSGFCAIGQKASSRILGKDERPIGLSEASDAGSASDAMPAATTIKQADKHEALRKAASDVVAAWDALSNDKANLAAVLQGPIAQLRAMIVEQAKTKIAKFPSVSRPGTKRELVLALLNRPEGASGSGIAEATGWAAHTVRGFLAGLKKSGCSVEVLRRVSGGNSGEGPKRPFSVYRVSDGR